MQNRYRYLKGVKKERKFVKEARASGYISFRSAGSHSPVDVVIIDPVMKRMKLLQCKPDSMTENAKMKIILSHEDLDGMYSVSFEVV